jgi:hypothetical protein
MVDQIGEFLKEMEKNTNSELPASFVEILKTAPEQEQSPPELVEWIKQVRIERDRYSYGYNEVVLTSDLMRTIAIRNYYSPIQFQKAEERATVELQNRTYGRRINRQYQKLTN